MDNSQENEIRENILAEVLSERVRQISEEGNTVELDDLGNPGRLAAAAACYGIHSAHELSEGIGLSGTPAWWPFNKVWWKPKSPRRNLIRALALILAEVEKMDRANAGSTEKTG